MAYAPPVTTHQHFTIAPGDYFSAEISIEQAGIILAWNLSSLSTFRMLHNVGDGQLDHIPIVQAINPIQVTKE